MGVTEKRVKDFPGSWKDGLSHDPCDDATWKNRLKQAKALVKKHKATGVLFDGWFRKTYYGEGKIAIGFCYADVRGRFPSGWRIFTSLVQKKSKKTEDGYYVVETLNSTYIVFPAAKPKERAPA